MLLRLGGGKSGKLQKFWAVSASFKPISCKCVAEVSKNNSLHLSVFLWRAI